MDTDRITISRSDLCVVYEYARQFDVDDDAAMIRVLAALEGFNDAAGSGVAQVRSGLDLPGQSQANPGSTTIP